MRSNYCYSRHGLLVVCLAVMSVAVTRSHCHAASFGINFPGVHSDGTWGPYFINPANGTSANGAGPYESAYGVAAADWYEPTGPGGITVGSTTQLEGAPESVPFSPASMGAGSVSISFSSAQGPNGDPQFGFARSSLGFANANSFVMQEDEDGNRLLDQNGHWIPVVENGDWVLAPENGRPTTGEDAILTGFLFGVKDDPAMWPDRDIVVTITGMSSIASQYHVKLMAAAQNGFTVEGFTPASIMDNAGNSDMPEFEILPQRPSWWSPFTPDPNSIYVAIGGVATSGMTFTGDELEIRLSGGNEYLNDQGAFFRTLLSGVVIEYEPISGLAGDHNGDGSVDAADYVFWRDTMGDDDRYNEWRSNFGAGGSGSVTGATVPEPTTWSLLAGAVVAMLAMRSTRRR